ncbi:MAG: N-acetylmuramoyl-L-alanine amidase [Paraclostridium sp.]
MKNNRLINGSVIGSAKVTVDILPKGYGIPNTKITPTSITIHNTGNDNSTSKNNHTYMKNINKSGERKASWHFTVDDKEIYQAQSTNYKCLHAGDTTGNNTSIGIEICQFRDKDKQLKAYRNAIELIKVLLGYHKFSINVVRQHNYWSGKNCPSVLRAGTYGYNWNWFIEQCKGNTQGSSSTTFKNGDYSGRRAIVTASVLNVRYDRGTQYNVIGKLEKGTKVNLQYCLNGWISVDGFKGNKGLGYISTDYLELI